MGAIALMVVGGRVAVAGAHRPGIEGGWHGTDVADEYPDGKCYED